MDDTISNRLEEYKELRSEIREYLARRQHTRHFAYIITLGVLGFAFQQKVPFVFFTMPPLILFFLWSDENRRLKAIQRFGTYIKTVIEPDVPGLMWESLSLNSIRSHSVFSRVMSNGDFPILYIFLAALFCNKSYSKSIVFFILAISVYTLLFIFMLVESYNIAKHGEKKETELWQKTLSQLQNK